MTKKTLGKMIIILLSSLIFYVNLYGQGKPYEGPDDPAGDQAAIRDGYMNGNRVLLHFLNMLSGLLLDLH